MKAQIANVLDYGAEHKTHAKQENIGEMWAFLSLNLM